MIKYKKSKCVELWYSNVSWLLNTCKVVLKCKTRCLHRLSEKCKFNIFMMHYIKYSVYLNYKMSIKISV